MDSLLDFSGKTAMITGAGQGFGRLLAEGLAARGAQLVISDINEAAVKAVAAKLNGLGGRVIAMKVDVSSEALCRAQVNAAIDQFGGLDIAINNAGVAHDFMAFEDVDEALMDRQWAINVKGVQFAMKYQLAHMKQRQAGAILNVSSMAGINGAPKVSAYAAAKHAVIGLTKSAAVECAKYGVRINAVCPYFALTPMVTDSEMAKLAGLDEIKNSLSRNVPIQRLAEPEEIVNAMILLLSPANSYMTGQAIAIDGGMSAI